jgi:primosomal protein N' (replication factor Y)
MASPVSSTLPKLYGSLASITPMSADRTGGPEMIASPAPVGLPVARVAVDSPLPHLDRPFDYLIPPELDGVIRPGSRVRVKFAGRLIDGWVLDRVASSGHGGTLAPLQRGVGDEPVLTPETSALFRAVADRWAGTFADVVRLGVPSRHARAESVGPGEPPPPVAPPGPEGWSRYRAGAAFLSALGDGRPARAVWSAMPTEDWPVRLAEAVQAGLAGGHGVIVVVPDARDVDRLDAAMATVLPKGAYVSLTAQLGPETRYRRWLAVRRGAVSAVIGTRSAIFAPVANLGLVAVFDDGDDLLAEPRAPYPHARDVAVLRASMARSALLIGGFARTAEAALLVESGWAHEIVADRSVLRAATPQILATGDDFELARDPAARSARLPGVAFRAARAALARDTPVLVQVPRRGYTPTLSCAVDRSPVRCAHCHGPVGVPERDAVAQCRWCGRPAADWHCPVCHGTRTRAAVIGSARTAEEIGRAFASTVVRTSGGDSVSAEVPPGPSIVIATPGAEPVVAGGYGAVLLLDGWAMLSRPDLRSAEETFRRWCNAVALAAADATVVVGADASIPGVQALIRWDPAGIAQRELADRRALDFPPISRLASVTGRPADIAVLLASARLPDRAEELGSVPVPPTRAAKRPGSALPEPGEEQIRTLLRVPRAQGIALAEALHAAAATGSAKKSGRAVRIALDPLELW